MHVPINIFIRTMCTHTIVHLALINNNSNKLEACTVCTQPWCTLSITAVCVQALEPTSGSHPGHHMQGPAQPTHTNTYILPQKGTCEQPPCNTFKVSHRNLLTIRHWRMPVATHSSTSQSMPAAPGSTALTIPKASRLMLLVNSHTHASSGQIFMNIRNCCRL